MNPELVTKTPMARDATQRVSQLNVKFCEVKLKKKNFRISKLRSEI